MTCEHLNKLEKELIEKGIVEISRGQAWSDNCREWVYFDCVFVDLEKTIQRFGMDNVLVTIHSHLGTHDGQEHGLVCEKCNDAIMGLHPVYAKGKSTKPLEYI